MKPTINWVFLLLENDNNEILLITENNDNNRPWKKHGQFSVPAGTIDEYENIEQTIHREFQEETWLNGLATIVEETLKEIGELFLETEEYKLYGRVYKGKIPITTQEKVKNFSSEEVGKVQVMHPEYILNQATESIRPGLLEVLLLKHNISSDTVYIENGIYRDLDQAKEKVSQLKQLYNNAETECCS